MQQQWLKINGCDFNLTEVSGFTLAQFKKEFEHSYCIDKTEVELKETWQLLTGNKEKVAPGPGDETKKM